MRSRCILSLPFPLVPGFRHAHSAGSRSCGVAGRFIFHHHNCKRNPVPEFRSVFNVTEHWIPPKRLQQWLAISCADDRCLLAHRSSAQWFTNDRPSMTREAFSGRVPGSGEAVIVPAVILTFPVRVTKVRLGDWTIPFCVLCFFLSSYLRSCTAVFGWREAACSWLEVVGYP